MHIHYSLYHEYFRLLRRARGNSFENELDITEACILLYRANTPFDLALLLERCVHREFPDWFLHGLLMRMRQPRFSQVQEIEMDVQRDNEMRAVTEADRDPWEDVGDSRSVEFYAFLEANFEWDVWRSVVSQVCGASISNEKFGTALAVCRYFHSHLLYELNPIYNVSETIFEGLVPRDSVSRLEVAYEPLLNAYLSRAMASWDEDVERSHQGWS